MANHDGRDERAETIGRLEWGLGVLEPRLRLDEARRSQARQLILRVGEVRRVREATDEVRVRRGVRDLTRELQKALQVSEPAALRMKPAAGFQKSREPFEERVVVVHPVERGGAEDDIGVQRHREVPQVDRVQRDVGPELCARLPEHRLGQVEGRHFSARHTLHQVRSQPARAAPRIDDVLVAIQLQIRHHLEAPTKLRLGHLVVALGIPVDGGHGTSHLRLRRRLPAN